jgi:hypothetical protein
MQDLINDLEKFADNWGLSPSTVCLYAGAGGAFYSRVKAGSDYTVRTEKKIRDFMLGYTGDFSYRKEVLKAHPKSK